VKSILITAVAVFAALSVYGQGNVNFANIGVGLSSPFVDNTSSGGGAPINGGTWTIELWAGPNASDVGAARAGAAFSGAFANGFFNAGQRTVSNVTTAVSAFAQVRFWDNMGGTITSWQQATATTTVRIASSSWFVISLSQPPAPPATMVNMPPVYVWAIPEPSTIALGLLGLVGAVVSTRRR
jgi:hypothetical protein